MGHTVDSLMSLPSLSNTNSALGAQANMHVHVTAFIFFFFYRVVLWKLSRPFQSNVTVTRPFWKALLELSHPVIIKLSRGTILKWQISLCFIYPTVSIPLHGEFVSIGTRCYFGLHELCDTFHVSVVFWLSLLFSLLPALVTEMGEGETSLY